MKIKSTEYRKFVHRIVDKRNSRLRVTLKLLIVAIMLPIALVTIFKTPISTVIVESSFGVLGINKNFIDVGCYGLGGVIICACAALLRGRHPHSAAYVLGFIAFNLAVLQYYQFGVQLPHVNTSGLVLNSIDTNTDHGVVIASLVFVAMISVTLALVSIRGQFINVQKQIASV